jgi:hypothetical protein
VAEFQEVAKHWKRMCNKYWRSTTCSGCPIAENEKAYKACSSYDIDVGKMEELVMAWAAEHPEPVYPTWGEYISMQILHGICLGKRCDYESTLEYAMGERIPADIAEKLGIEPKEG